MSNVTRMREDYCKHQAIGCLRYQNWLDNTLKNDDDDVIKIVEDKDKLIIYPCNNITSKETEIKSVFVCPPSE